MNIMVKSLMKIIISDIKLGAKEFLEKLSKNTELYLFTTRNLILSTKWLMENKIDKLMLL